MDIIFQSGEFYNASSGIWKTIIPALISSGLAMLTAFWVMNEKDKKDRQRDIDNDNEKSNKLFKKHVEFFKITLKQLIYQIDNELELVRDAKSQSEKREFILIKTNHSVSLKTDRLFQTIPYNEITNIFSKYNFEKDAYLFFISYIDILANYDSNIERINNSIHQTFIQNLKNFNQTTNRILSYINTLKDRKNRNHAENLLINNWDKLTDDYYSDHLKNNFDLNEPYYKGDKIFSKMYLYLFQNNLTTTFREFNNLILEAQGYLYQQDEYRAMNIKTYNNFETELTRVWQNFVSVYNTLTEKEDEKFH